MLLFQCLRASEHSSLQTRSGMLIFRPRLLCPACRKDWSARLPCPCLDASVRHGSTLGKTPQSVQCVCLQGVCAATRLRHCAQPFIHTSAHPQYTSGSLSKDPLVASSSSVCRATRSAASARKSGVCTENTHARTHTHTHTHT